MRLKYRKDGVGAIPSWDGITCRAMASRSQTFISLSFWIALARYGGDDDGRAGCTKMLF